MEQAVHNFVFLGYKLMIMWLYCNTCTVFDLTTVTGCLAPGTWFLFLGHAHAKNENILVRVWPGNGTGVPWDPSCCLHVSNLSHGWTLLLAVWPLRTTPTLCVNSCMFMSVQLYMVSNIMRLCSIQPGSNSCGELMTVCVCVCVCVFSLQLVW